MIERKDYDIHINIKTGHRLDRKEKGALRKALRDHTEMSVRDVRPGETYAIALGEVYNFAGTEEAAKMVFDEVTNEVRKLYPGAYVDMIWTEIPESTYIFETTDVRD